MRNARLSATRNGHTLEEKINSELVNLLYIQSKSTIPSAILTALCLIYALWNAIPFWILFNWFCLICLVSTLRYITYRLYLYAKPPIEETDYWHFLFMVTSVFGGINWMLLGTVLFPLASTDQMLVAFALASIVAISVSLFAASRLCSVLFAVIVLAPFSIQMLLQPNTQHQLIAIFSFLYFMTLIFSILRVHRELYDMFKLQIENNELIQRLYATKNEVEMVNKELQIEINEHSAVENLLRNSEEQYRLLMDALPVLIAYIDTDLYFRFNNKAYQEWFDKPLTEIIGMPVQKVFGDAGFATFSEHYQQILAGKQVSYETTMFFHQDQERYVSVILIPHRHNNMIMGTFSLISDMTPRINYLATHDSLTNLPNRRLFNARVMLALKHAHRHGTQVALLFLDLDHFKNVNDTLGHDVGDQLLIKVVERLQSCINPNDTIARLGGDEFIIILEDNYDLERPTSVAKKICASFANAFHLGERELFITTSIGISLYPEDGDNLQILMKNADMAMYRAKERGRNTFEFYTGGMNEVIQKKLRIETSLRGALERGELQLYYQPLLDMKKNKISGVEALLRWNNPELGFVSPGEFIPIAEETDLIVPIGEWVLRTACMQNLLWQKAGYLPLRITVNLSARQFMKRNLVATIEQILNETKMAGKYLTLELTENLVMGDLDHSIKIINGLKALDVTISLDDFGTGYSSLSYLKRFPFDIIKIDRSFVTDFAVNIGDAAIVKAIIAIAHNLKMRVTAEGVETPEQYLFLKENGCDEMQGYLFYPPLSELDMTQVMQNRVEEVYSKKNHF